MDGVAGWFERRGEIPLARPPGFREYGPLADDPDRPDEDFTSDSVRGVAFALEYCDFHGWASTRTVRCLALDPSNRACLKAYCNVRRTTRTFRLDRIISIASLRTGEILSGHEHVALFAPYLPGESLSPRQQLFCELREETKDGVFVLLQLAMADGRLGERCRQVVLDYVRAEAEAVRCPLPPADAVELWIDNLSPPLDVVIDAVANLLADKEKLARLLPWLLKVVRSQDSFAVQDEAIRDLIAEIRGHFRRQLPDRAAYFRSVSFANPAAG